MTNPKKCFAPNCDKLTGGKPFFMIPPDNEQRKFWFKAVGRNDLKNAPKLLFSCSGHYFNLKEKFPKSITKKAKQQQQPNSTYSTFAQYIKKDTTMDRICRLCLNSPRENMINIFGTETIIFEGMRTVIHAVQLIHTFTDVPKSQLENKSFPQQICCICFRHLCVMSTFRENCRQSNGKLVAFLGETMAKDATIDRQPNHCTETKFVEAEHTELVEVVDTLFDRQPNHCTETKYVKAEHTELVEVVDTLFDQQPNDTETKFGAEHVEVLDTAASEPDVLLNYLKQVKCRQCKTIYDSREELKYHIKSRHKHEHVYKCFVKKCSMKYKTLDSLQIHHAAKHSHDGSDDYICTICNRHFDRHTTLRSHLQRHDEPKFMCDVCGKKFKTRTAIKNHMLVHSGARNFVCEVCSKAYQTPYTLRIHMRMHTNEKPFICHVCANAFSLKCTLKLHLNKYHPHESV